MNPTIQHNNRRISEQLHYAFNIVKTLIEFQTLYEKSVTTNTEINLLVLISRVKPK